MAVKLPRLDDRTYSDLVEEGLRVVASGDGKWTNHNPSDPGITVLELLAYVTELLMYRASQITDEDLRAFASLLSSPEASTNTNAADALRQAVLASRRRERLVSVDDYEAAARAVDRQRIARAHCVVDRDLTLPTSAARQAIRPGHMTVLIVPRGTDDDLEALRAKVADDLGERRLVTTRVHVGVPEAVEIGVRLAVGIAPGTSPSTARAQIEDALARFFEPANGGPSGEGWPLGRSVYVSEIYHASDRLPAVDYVSRVIDARTDQALDELVVASGHALERNAETKELVALRLEPHQVVRARSDAHRIQLRRGSIDLATTLEG